MQHVTSRPALILSTLAVALLLSPAQIAFAQTVNLAVAGNGDLWLAGMPDGSTADGADVAPFQSPTQVTGLNLGAGGYLTFAATGAVNNNGGVPGPAENRPDGGFNDGNFEYGVHRAGAQNGIGDVRMPMNALMGVFLSIDAPNLTAAPASVDFENNLDYTTFSPVLKQPFFIGNGLTGIRTETGAAQRIIIPLGATRLYLAPMDQFDYFDNQGGFNVTVSQVTPTVVPEANTLALALPALAIISTVLVRRRCNTK